MDIAVVTITPELAKEWLANNPNNRPLRPRLVERFADDMREGRWQLDGSPIRRNGTGQLLDGQHRLEACVLAGVSFTTLVINGLPSSVMETIDTGARRTLGDLLKLRGEHNYRALASAIPVAMQWETGTLRQNLRPSPSASLAWLQANPTIREAVVAVNDLRKPPLCLLPRCAAPFAFRAAALAPEETATFLDRLESGANLDAMDPIMGLRRWLMRTRDLNVNVSVYQTLGTLIKAFNYWLAGAEVEVFTFRAGEAFPELGGGPGRYQRERKRDRRGDDLQ